MGCEAVNKQCLVMVWPGRSLQGIWTRVGVKHVVEGLGQTCCSIAISSDNASVTDVPQMRRKCDA